MEDGLDYKPTADKIWPPAPTLLAPEPVRSQSVLVRGGVLVPVLISVGEGILGLGTNYLQQWTGHKHHFVDRSEVCFSGMTMFALLLPVNIWIRSRVLTQRRKEEAEFSLKAKAVEQNATE